MCEEKRAIRNLPQMLKEVPGIGVVLIGEGDLSQDMGYPRQYEHPEVAAAIDEILAICKDAGVPCGHPHVEANNVEKLVEKGFRWLMPAPTQSFAALEKGLRGERAEIAARRAPVGCGGRHMTTTRRAVVSAACVGLAAAVARKQCSVRCRARRGTGGDLGLRENFAVEHEIGHRFRIDPASLPPPGPATLGQQRAPDRRVCRAGAECAAGFHGDTVRDRHPEPAPAARAAERRRAGGNAERRRRCCCCATTAAGGPPRASAMPGASTGLRAGVARQRAARCRPGRDLARAEPGARSEPVTRRGVFGADRGHNNRPIAIDPRTGALFAGVGSMGNIAVEPEPKATIQHFGPDGSNQTSYAAGTRNPTALAVHPQTGELWAGVQERDGLGDNLPSDYLIRVRQGGFYGWPYAYIGPHPQPGFAERAPDKVAATIVPDLLFQAHSSLLDLVFYEGAQFPAQYRGGAFAALKGSWNRSLPTGYKIVFVPFQNGQPAGYYENFATGFWVSGEHRAEVWGRPAALAVAKDGALLVGDDTGGTIWRIAYTGGR